MEAQTEPRMCASFADNNFTNNKQVPASILGLKWLSEPHPPSHFHAEPSQLTPPLTVFTLRFSYETLAPRDYIYDPYSYNLTSFRLWCT